MILPAAATASICSFLTGLDVISLTHSSAFWLQHLNSSPYWQSKLPSRSDPLHASAYKALYIRSRSLSFAGLHISDSDSVTRASDSYAVIDHVSSMKGSRVQLSSLRDTSFSFDIWFALLPDDPAKAYNGGILYGLQSVHAESRVWPQFHQQFVVISATGDLFCSVIDHRPVVKSGLQVERWYHLALTYDRKAHRQDVYLDGVKVRSDTGTLHREMDFLKHEQVGTGCITANGLHFPKPGYLGWYGFHGVIDEFRVWNDVLSEQNVAILSRGEDQVANTLLGALKMSGRPSRGLRWNVFQVRCSRPVEGRRLQVVKKNRRNIAVVRPEQLPGDTIESLCSYLTGFDAFNLSQTNFWWKEYFSDESIWKRALGENTTDEVGEQLMQSWKEQYMQARSMLFRGLQEVDNRQVDSYAYFAYAGNEQRRQTRFRLNFLGSENFSFDVWFSLLPGTSGQVFGGIIYGQQSASRESRKWPHYHQQFVLVSSTGDLYCSVLDSRPVVASDLEPYRWYHLALTYNNDAQSQDVYMDGVKIHSSTGGLHHEWGYLTNEQVGTGCVTAGNLNFPRPNCLGWYGFHGVIDDFRVWGDTLGEDDVVTLARGGSLPNRRLQASIKDDTTGEHRDRPLTWINVQRIMCTRPTEGRAMHLEQYRSSSQPNCVIS